MEALGDTSGVCSLLVVVIQMGCALTWMMAPRAGAHCATAKQPRTTAMEPRARGNHTFSLQ